MPLHLVKVNDGYLIVERFPGPYSVSPPIDRAVLALSQADLDQFAEDMKPVPTPEAPVPTPEPPVPTPEA